MRSSGSARRTTAAVLAATFGILTSTYPAAAAPSEQQRPPWSPPPTDSSQAPSDTGQPDQNYEKKTECVQRDVSQQDLDPPNKPWGQQYLQLNRVHNYMRSTTGGAGMSGGNGLKVAVIDTGVTQHPYFQGRVEGGGDYVKPEMNGLEDCDGHGTEVAGIIAGKPTDPGIGFVGVAPDARILSIRQTSQNYHPEEKKAPPAPPPPPAAPPGGEQPPPGEPPPAGEESAPSSASARPAQGGQDGRAQGQDNAAGKVETLAQAVVRASNDPEVKVINMSVDNCRLADGTITTGERKLQAAIDRAVNEKNVVVVAAAGNTTESCPQNDNPDPNKPKSIVTPPWFANNVLSVAGVDESGGAAQFSMHGPWVSVAAPGTNIISLDPVKGSDRLANQTVENGETQNIQGTSFAAPYVSGLAALVRSKFPQLDAKAVMNRIATTAQHPAAPGGRDNFVGHGIINPMDALTASIPAEENIPLATAEQLPSDIPPADDGNTVQMAVALGGAGGGVAALAITLFVVHTIRRNRGQTDQGPREIV